MPRDRRVEELCYSVIGAFYEVYNVLGHGLFEHLYARALERELRARGRRVDREVAVIVYYKGEAIGAQRLDMIVDDVLVVEIKSTQLFPKAALRQTYNYLAASDLAHGLVLHFGEQAAFYHVDKKRRD